MRHRASLLVASSLALVAVGCDGGTPDPVPRASGYVEATETHVASRVAGRVEDVRVDEGDRVSAGDVLVSLSTAEIALAVRRAAAERAHAQAQLQVLLAGARPEDLDVAQAQLDGAIAERTAAEAELLTAQAEVARFERLVRNGAGAQKPLDDAVAHRDQAAARLSGSTNAVRAAEASLARARAGARPEELQVARARVETADAQIAALEHDREEATVRAPTDGVVATRLVQPGELMSPGQPLLVLIDLDRAWVNAYVEEPLVPDLRLGQAASVMTDAGDELPGRVTFISPRAEFTPRNVQTSEERAKLVYRVKVTVDNRQGILKPGMPAEVRFGEGG